MSGESAATGLTAQVLDTLDALDALRAEWAELWAADPRATPFSSPAWLLSWARAFRANRPWVLTLRRAGSLVALVPLCVYQGRWMMLGAGTTDYADALVCPGEDGGETTTLIAWELAQAGLKPPGHEPDPPAAVERGGGYLAQLPKGSLLLRLGTTPQPAEACSRLRVGAALPAKLRRSVGYYRRRAAALGQVTWQCASTPSEALEAFARLAELHRRRWHLLGEGGVLADEQVLAHHREALPALLHAGLLRLFTLRVAGRPVAVAYALADRAGPPAQERSQAPRARSWFYYLTGFDPQYAALSPGTLLLASLLDEAEADGATWLDLLRGDEGYKDLWAAEPVETFGIAL